MTGPHLQGEAGPAAGTLAQQVRRHDPDRFLFSLFLPAEIREAAWILIAFNHELARAIESGARRDNDTGRFASLVRLQWWRDIVGGARLRHEVATPLGALLDAGRLEAARLEAMIAAREAELDGIADAPSWHDNLRAGPGNLARLMGELAGADAGALDALVAAGAAYGAGASLRNRASLLAVGRAPFPADIPDPTALATEASAHILPLPRRFTGPALAPALHAVLARRDLARARAGRVEAGPRGAADRLAVLRAWVRRRA